MRVFRQFMSLGPLFTLTLGIFACNGSSLGISQMESSEEQFNQRQKERLVAYMPIKTMFPDDRLRALAEAAASGNTRRMDQLIEDGIDVNELGTGNATVLFWAMKNDSLVGFKHLLELGANPNVVFDDGGSVMHWAASLESTEYLRLALENSGNPDLKAGELQETPIFRVVGFAGERDLKFAQLLLDHGADPNAQTIRGNSIAMIAARNNRFDLVYLLLERGASWNVENNDGYTFLGDVAEKRGFYISGSDQEKDLNRVIVWLQLQGATVP